MDEDRKLCHQTAQLLQILKGGEKKKKLKCCIDLFEVLIVQIYSYKVSRLSVNGIHNCINETD